MIPFRKEMPVIQKRKILTALFVCLMTIAAYGLSETLHVQNTPIKGQILLG